jgi:eukaryotic-like serine/threonine-protein kinase
VVLRALAKDPARRFADADEFIAALQAARRAPERAVVLEPTPGEPWEAVEAVEEEGRRWWLWLLALLVLAALAAGAYLLFANRQVTVPSVVGRTSARAAQILHRRAFEVRIVNRVDANAPQDRVIAQSPAAGDTARKGSTVIVTVSAGPGQAPVPTVQGLSRADAEQALKQAGLKSRVRRENSDTVPSGTVVDSQPAQGTEVDKGSTVTLLVSKGRAKVTVPNVTGLASGTAQSELRQAGLDVTITHRTSTSAAAGTVLSQDPAGGASVPRGSAVEIVLAKRPPRVAVPDVTTGNPAEADARTTLTQAGFKVRVRHQTVTDPTQDGKVLAQTPAAGQKRSKGATITITVGQAAASTPTPTPTASPTPTPSATP